MPIFYFYNISTNAKPDKANGLVILSEVESDHQVAWIQVWQLLILFHYYVIATIL